MYCLNHFAVESMEQNQEITNTNEKSKLKFNEQCSLYASRLTHLSLLLTISYLQLLHSFFPQNSELTFRNLASYM